MHSLSHQPLSDDAMPPNWDLDLEERLAKAINRVADREDFMEYFRETWTCFVSGAFNSALISIHTASSCYIRRFVERYVYEVFSRYHRIYLEAKAGTASEEIIAPPALLDLSKVKDGNLIDICKEARILPFGSENMEATLDWYLRLRLRRNALAHGEWKPRVAPEEVAIAAENAVNYLFKFRLKDHTLALDAQTVITLVAYGEDVLEPGEVERLIVAVPQDDRLRLVEQLLDLYRSEQDYIYVASFEKDPPRSIPLRKSLPRIRSFIFHANQLLDGQDRESFLKRVVNLIGECSGTSLKLEKSEWVTSERGCFTGISEVSRTRFLSLVELRIWSQHDLPQIYRSGLYEAIVRFLDLDWGEYGDNIDLPTSLFSRLRRDAPSEFRSRMDEFAQRI